jgi:hypothetical protein
MAAKLSALLTGRALPPETLFFCVWYSLLLEAEGLGKLIKNVFTSSGLEPATFRLVA